jgi:flotillin
MDDTGPGGGRRPAHGVHPSVDRLVGAAEARPGLALLFLVTGVCALVLAINLAAANWMFLAVLVVLLPIIGALVKNRPLRDHEVGVISGRWTGKTRIVMQGHPVALPGENLTILSVGRRDVPVDVLGAPSRDNVRVDLHLVGTFSVRRTEEAILAVSGKLACDARQMADRVRLTVAEQVRLLVSKVAAGEMDRWAAHLSAHALQRARPVLLDLGLELNELNIVTVTLPARLRETLENETVLRQAAEEVLAKQRIERMKLEEQLAVERARSDQARDLLSAEHRARTDDDRYTEAKELETIESRMDLDRKHLDAMNQIQQRAAEEKARLEAEVARLTMENTLIGLSGRLAAETEHSRTIALQKLIDQLPAIYAAKNQILPNLRTVMGGSDGNIVGLVERIAHLTPDVLPEIKAFLDTVLGGGGALLGPEPAAGAPRAIPGHAAQTGPADGQRFAAPSRDPRPADPPAGDQGWRL